MCVVSPSNLLLRVIGGFLPFDVFSLGKGGFFLGKICKTKKKGGGEVDSGQKKKVGGKKSLTCNTKPSRDSVPKKKREKKREKKRLWDARQVATGGLRRKRC